MQYLTKSILHLVKFIIYFVIPFKSTNGMEYSWELVTMATDRREFYDTINPRVLKLKPLEFISVLTIKYWPTSTPFQIKHEYD